MWLSNFLVFQKPLLERTLARHRYGYNSIVERLLTRDRLTNDSLEGIRLLAETVRTTTTPSQEYLRVLNQRTRVWKEKAQKLSKPRGIDPLPTCGVRKRERHKVDHS
jgi:hypothetical protein